MLKKYFGARIKEIREAKGLNQEKLAEIVNMESRQISRIETGKSFTSLENLVNISRALNVEIEEFFSFRHKQPKDVLINKINELLLLADEKKVELIYKLVEAVLK